jgi:hypothetical protein
MTTTRKGIRFSDGCLTGFLEDDQRDDVAAIHPFRVPVDDVFSRVSHGISPLLGFLIPIYQRAGPTDVDDFRDEILREGRQRRAQHVGILDKFREGSRDTVVAVGQFEGRFTAEDQAHIAVRSASGSVEE